MLVISSFLFAGFLHIGESLCEMQIQLASIDYTPSQPLCSSYNCRISSSSSNVQDVALVLTDLTETKRHYPQPRTQSNTPTRPLHPITSQYTLGNLSIEKFKEFWSHSNICFSTHGSLRSTIWEPLVWDDLRQL